jgi:hypothetical protein
LFESQSQETADVKSKDEVGGLLLPGALPKPRLRPLFRRQQRVQRRYRWHLCVALYGGTMPGKNRAFTTLVDPVSPPSIRLFSEAEENGGGAGYRPRVRYAYATRRLSP